MKVDNHIAKNAYRLAPYKRRTVACVALAAIALAAGAVILVSQMGWEKTVLGNKKLVLIIAASSGGAAVLSCSVLEAKGWQKQKFVVISWNLDHKSKGDHILKNAIAFAPQKASIIALQKVSEQHGSTEGILAQIKKTHTVIVAENGNAIALNPNRFSLLEDKENVRAVDAGVVATVRCLMSGRIFDVASACATNNDDTLALFAEVRGQPSVVLGNICASDVSKWNYTFHTAESSETQINVAAVRQLPVKSNLKVVDGAEGTHASDHQPIEIELAV